nr:immunoglobulin heavy chain junction region [Macaca mulatta]MPN83898.1 immunoglobulin heavy chain junction region [Macaca mulatta]MPN83959.1 immunoglobulin heavy chain junction region [Macaca mulatta]MPN83998.1 immunoglobulin heavy chain junction region [Macaca mulatta]MPN83999.1 immunoglobulin heavy chain junction region [Macaca mulatta]
CARDGGSFYYGLDSW